ncbi:MAG TPA: S41 family peptidase, partial [Methanoregula sp.]|nr:S41 family peptidase [Methanoregula sp.]
VVGYVANGSAAEQAGIRSGDEVTGWNGVEIHEAINATSFIWAYKKPSTEEGIRVQKTRLLARAPVGTPAMVKITYGSIPHPRVLNLTAYDDRYDSLAHGTFYLGKAVNDIGTDDQLHGIRPLVTNDTVTVKTLKNGYTYIAVYEESYEVYQPFRAAMLSAIANKSPGIVLDLRFNSGGDDNLAACMAGWFVDKPVFYEYGTKYDPGTQQFPVLTEAWSQPQAVRYEGPVAVMVSPDTISSGEGVPNVFVRSGRGAVVSFYGSNGAFGMNNFQAILPLGLYILFPDGASLDENQTIQVDSNASLRGGVSPTVRVPLTRETLARAMDGEDVQLTYATDWLDSQQPVAATVPTTPAKKAPAGILAAVLAVAGMILVRKA